MLIGEISEKAELTRDAIRFYEKKGLLKVEKRNSVFNNYKHYTLAHLRRLQMIKKAKKFGFTINEIRGLFQLLDERSMNCGQLERRMLEKIADIDRQIQELKDIKNTIFSGIEKAQQTCSAGNQIDHCSLLTGHK